MAIDFQTLRQKLYSEIVQAMGGEADVYWSQVPGDAKYPCVLIQRLTASTNDNLRVFGKEYAVESLYLITIMTDSDAASETFVAQKLQSLHDRLNDWQRRDANIMLCRRQAVGPDAYFTLGGRSVYSDAASYSIWARSE